MFPLFCVCCVLLNRYVLSFLALVLCLIVLSLSSVVLCFVLLKGDWMGR